MTSPRFLRHYTAPAPTVADLRGRRQRRISWLFVLGYALMSIALAISLYWNVKQAREKTAAIDDAFTRGHTAGIRWAELTVQRMVILNFLQQEAAAQAREQKQEEEEKEEQAKANKL